MEKIFGNEKETSEEEIVPNTKFIKNDELMKPISLLELQRILKDKKNGSAPGIDEIPYECYKRANEEIQTKMLQIMNKIIEQKQAPRNWKETMVWWILKEGKPEFILEGSYRPISLMKTILKIFTSKINDRLKTTLLKNEILKGQYAFQSGEDMISAISKALNTLKQARKEKKHATAILLDITGAYDYSPHSAVDKALKYFGFDKNFRKLISDLLTPLTNLFLEHMSIF
jgi:hypothetical protein